MLAGERRVVELELSERAGPEVLDDDVALGDESVEEGAAGWPLEIDRDALLVAIDAQKICALALDEGRTPRARIVAFSRLLDLDHARAHVGKQHGAVRTREHARQIENGDTLERGHSREMR